MNKVGFRAVSRKYSIHKKTLVCTQMHSHIHIPHLKPGIKSKKRQGEQNEKRKEKERKVCGKHYPKILTMISFLNKIFCVCLPARPNLW